MNQGTIRLILRWIHIVFSIPILGYIYSPFDKIPNYAPRDSVCLCSHNGPFGIVDVERPSPSTTYFEKTGQTRRCGETTRMKTGQEFEASRSNESIGTY